VGDNPDGKPAARDERGRGWATASVAWALHVSRRELVALEDELEELRDLARSRQADEDDYKTMNKIEVKLARTRARQQHP